MNIAVIGTGYVGVVTAAVFADFGNQIWGLDIDDQRVKGLTKGKSPIFEPGLEELLKRGLKGGRLHFTTSYKEALDNSDIVFVCVGTPQQHNGEVDLSYVEASIETIAKTMTKPTVIVLKSTVPPGIHKHLTTIIDKHTNIKYEFASAPEFLREGTAITDTLNPSRIVIGAESERAKEMLLDIHAQLPGERIVTDIISAQMIKYAANSFLATKISFANAVARVCDLIDADVQAVMKGIGLDPRIGEMFLCPGLGFGGSCFPKDIKGLYHIALQSGYDFKLLKEVDDINESQVPYILGRTKKLINSFKGLKVAVLGLAFKPDTDDMRDARSIPLITSLLKEGASVVAYDPVAIETARKVFEDNITYADNAYIATQEADIVFVATDWNEFKELDLAKVKKSMRGNVLVDGRNIYEPKKVKKLGFQYIGVGRR
ncbi:MAG: UDP-glucose dehydrogenase family protein [Patescibacteria group bacterium]|jgi:UDPglucose 6-dehydrogenase